MMFGIPNIQKWGLVYFNFEQYLLATSLDLSGHGSYSTV